MGSNPTPATKLDFLKKISVKYFLPQSHRERELTPGVAGVDVSGLELSIKPFLEMPDTERRAQVRKLLKKIS